MARTRPVTANKWLNMAAAIGLAPVAMGWHISSPVGRLLLGLHEKIVVAVHERVVGSAQLRLGPSNGWVSVAAHNPPDAEKHPALPNLHGSISGRGRPGRVIAASRR
jgi:hypothetical protein